MTSRSLPDPSHRPWPLPPLPWVMFQSWRQLAFIHWHVPADDLRRLVPLQLDLDEFDGSGWVGLTPFRLTRLRPRYMPPLPGVSEFLEMNLRTYVRHRGRPGIFFFTLEAASRLAVAAARATYRLPYHHARMSIREDGEWTHYRSKRPAPGASEFVGSYRPVGPSFEAAPGSLEHFLVERYALFTVLRNGRVIRGDIHHAPWRLQSAEVKVERNTLLSEYGIRPPEQRPLVHYSARQDTYVWPPMLDD